MAALPRCCILVVSDTAGLVTLLRLSADLRAGRTAVLRPGVALLSAARRLLVRAQQRRPGRYRTIWRRQCRSPAGMIINYAK